MEEEGPSAEGDGSRGSSPRAQLCGALDESPLRKPTGPDLWPLSLAMRHLDLARPGCAWTRGDLRAVPADSVPTTLPGTPVSLLLGSGVGGASPRVLIVTSPHSGQS